ncbi:DUF4260 domain-containing protein [Phenylobacterium sp.]|uniref:DUF4260 domain-containing protein n=1 Tax=Phenylobacterium sp. TaxID=1871053 RepID=UPI0025DF0EFF|nr:DUF4260 domain-containing protein [Phenylobacterium sp.]
MSAAAITTNSDARPAPSESSGATRGSVTVLLRLEAGIALVASIMAYRAVGGSWWLFAGLFLVPDLSMLGYLVNRRIGAAAYNFGHTYLSPAALAAAGFAAHAPTTYLWALIWAAHISFDRLVGYGLKYPQAFGATHLGHVGKRP